MLSSRLPATVMKGVSLEYRDFVAAPIWGPTPMVFSLLHCTCHKLSGLHNKGGIQGTIGSTGCVAEATQGKEVLDVGLAQPQACLSWAVQLLLLKPIKKPLIEDDGVEPVHSYGPAIGCVQGANRPDDLE